jgi:putative hemolysin
MRGGIERVNSSGSQNQERGRRMKCKLFTLVLVLTASTLIFGGCVTPTPEPDAGLANPASVYCEEQGYTLEARTDENGTYGVCIFPDGSECDEWAFFRGECGPGTGEGQSTEVPATPTEPAVQTTEPRVVEEVDVLFEGVSFSYGGALAADVVGQLIPAEGEDAPEWAWIPEHIRLSFEGYALPGTFHEPRILVFSAEDLAVSEMLQGIAANIQQVLAEKPDRPVGVFQAAGILPPMNAGHMMTPPQVAYLDFQNGTGVRFLTQMGQAYYPINNRDLFYTFQGMTHDGKYYVAAILPISHPSLPADGSEIPGDDFNTFADNFETYAAEVAAQLDAEAADSFAPSIVLLDEMMQSLKVADRSMAATHLPVVAWYGYVASTPDGAQFDDYLVLLPEEARRAVGIEGADEAVEAEIVALRDKEEPGKCAHFWGTLNCDVPDYGGCQLLATRLRVDGPGPFFAPDPVEGWQGTIASGPAGRRSGGDDYLVVLVGGISIAYGIDSVDATLAAQIESLRDTGAMVRVWGEVSAGVMDWNGTQIQVERLEIG